MTAACVVDMRDVQPGFHKGLQLDFVQVSENSGVIIVRAGNRGPSLDFWIPLRL